MFFSRNLQDLEGMGAGQQREIQEAKWSGGQIHLRQTLNEEAIADEFSECQQVSCPPAERRMNLSPPLSSAVCVHLLSHTFLLIIKNFDCFI